MSDKGILVVLSGFSGSGKGTIMKKIMNEYDNYSLSISATTRKPRVGEIDGREYYFKTKEEFETMIANDELIEYASYVDNYYGTPKSYVMEQLSIGKDVFLEIELQGAMKVKEQFKDAVFIFVAPPSAKVLKERLIGRNTESIDVINKRLKRASEEAEYSYNYDYIIVNDVLDECVIKLHNIVEAEHGKTFRNISFLDKIKEELASNSEGE